jgi:hypothetical protein
MTQARGARWDLPLVIGSVAVAMQWAKCSISGVNEPEYGMWIAICFG